MIGTLFLALTAYAASADEQVSLRAAAGYVPGPDYDAAAALASLKGIGASVLVVVAELDALIPLGPTFATDGADGEG